MVNGVSVKVAREIVKNRMPLGNFICFHNGVQAISNESGDAEVKRFITVTDAVEWLEK